MLTWGVTIFLVGHFVIYILSSRIINSPDVFGILFRSLSLLLIAVFGLLCIRPRQIFSYKSAAFLAASLLYAAGIVWSSQNIGGSISTVAALVAYIISPFVLILGARVTEKHSAALRDYLLVGTTVLSGIIIYYGSGAIGASRLGAWGTDKIISPLIISYMSAGMIGVIIYRLNTEKHSVFNLAYLLGSLIILSVAFGMGASRGSVIALMGGLIFQLLLTGGKGYRKLPIIVIVSVTVFAVLGGLGYFDALTSRVLTSTEMYAAGYEVSIRQSLMAAGIEGVKEAPFGFSSYILPGYDIYVHNIYLEAFLVGGIFCGGLFLYFCISTLLVSRKLALLSPAAGWLGIMYVQSLFRYAFSHTFFTAYYISIFSALILSLYAYARTQSRR